MDKKTIYGQIKLWTGQTNHKVCNLECSRDVVIDRETETDWTLQVWRRMEKISL